MTINRIIRYLLYIFFFTIALNPLFTYLFKIKEMHILILFLILFLSIATLLKKQKSKIKSVHLLIFIYVSIVILGVIDANSNLNFIIKALTYRILFPMLFILIFWVVDNQRNINSLGYNIIKIVNVMCIIIALCGLIEKINPQIIYKFYGNNLTQHLSLLLNGKKTTRLISLVGNPINLGFYMTIGIGSAIILILINLKKSKLIIIVEVLFIILFTYIMFLTYSRSAIITTLVMGFLILIFQLQRTNMRNKVLILVLIGIIYVFLGQVILNIDSINSRINTISLQHYFENTRFLRAYLAFNEGTSLLQFLFGHGIAQINNSGAYVFEFGYASLLYESGLLGFIVVITCYCKGILAGIKTKFKYNLKYLYVKDFYVAVIISGLVGMLVEDLYMQQPYSVFLWFSTIFLISYRL